ncbi:MAG: uroporphyrinogen decarboxylase family protein [Oscillospiraceae bacterium]|nr:uroporphyrinogen decarboxylase family protein [Oscillospiraceae bacterium]
MNMKQWVEQMKQPGPKKAMPVLSFPCISLMGITVKELIADSVLQAKGMKMVADRVPSAASVSMMDLSVEAEAFGAQVKFSDDEVPTVIGALVTDEDEADALKVPAVGTGRTGKYIEAIGEATKLITDRPVFAGVIGPFSLAGRLMDVSEAMVNCIVEPDMVHTTLEKATEFLINYIKAYKEQTGANGVVMAEPLAGMLSPALAEEFSEPYVRKIVEAVQDDEFIVIYHNCGDNVLLMIDSILRVGAAAYHFGNAISMKEMMTKVPADVLTMGNVDPSSQFCNGTPESIREETLRIMGECCDHANFGISSGCDIPPISKWENIDAFFAAVDEFYSK